MEIESEQAPPQEQESGSEGSSPSSPVEETLPAPDSSLLKINVVAEDVNNLKTEIKSLEDAAEKLNLHELVHNPLEGKTVVQQLHRKCIQYSEFLMKDLLTLDQITTSQVTRPLRKAQVPSLIFSFDTALGDNHPANDHASG
jgi:hypothetical protein